MFFSALEFMLTVFHNHGNPIIYYVEIKYTKGLKTNLHALKTSARHAKFLAPCLVYPRRDYLREVDYLPPGDYLREVVSAPLKC